MGFWPRHISWLTVVLAILTIGTFLAISGPGVRYITPMMKIGGGIRESADSSGKDSSIYYPYQYPNPDVPVTDTREFLKIYYNASMLSRDVQSLTRRVETTVRGYGGRLDQESNSPLYGFVSFVVSQSKYNAFRAELENLVDSRFLTVNISSQNLLSQKVSIEEQQKQADTSLSDYKTVRQKIINAHASAIQSLQSKIDAEGTTESDKALLRQQLASENASYAVQLKNVDANIKYAQDWQKAVQTQDQTLLDNVATVAGTVSIRWISLWDMAQLYLPGYWIPTIFAALTLLSFFRDRRRSTISATDAV